jgi:hypothetical protein
MGSTDGPKRDKSEGKRSGATVPFKRQCNQIYVSDWHKGTQSRPDTKAH